MMRESADRTSAGGITIKRGTIGILRRDGCYLMVRRAAGVTKAGYWCFPGGHLEPGENSRRAIKRELMEELGIDVEPTRRLGSLRVRDSGYILSVWLVEHRSGDLCPFPEEIAECRWVTPAGAREISPSLPSNDEVLRMLGH